MKGLRGNKGFTLIEAIISMAVLAVGIMAVASMQLRAIQANHSAFYRTNANLIATSFLEELKGLSFDDPLLDETSTSLANDTSAHEFSTESFTSFANTFRLLDDKLIDNSNRQFTLSWAVDDNTLSDSSTPSKTIKLFMSWDSLMGSGSLEITTVKYNNISN